MFRTTASAINNQAIQFANRFNTSIALYHKQISSGERLHRPSDHPIDFRQVISASARLNELEADSYTARDAESKLNFSVSQLTDANDLLVSAKVLVQQAIQATSDSEKTAIAIELEGILKTLQNIGNAKNAGTYAYSGTRADVAPFQYGDSLVHGGTMSVEYHGSLFASQAYVGQSVSVKTFYAGSQVFGANGRDETVMISNTGATLGSGTANLIGRATLQVRHLATSYESGSGIQPGTDSAQKDTVIGVMGAHSVRIIDTSGDGSAGTISLNDGPPVAFTSADSNLEVVGADGLRVFVNTTAITAGFNGVVNLQATGTLSVDGGLTTTVIGFTGDETVVDSTSERFARINTSAIRSTGDDYLEFPGTSNAFQIIYETIQDLRGGRELNNHEFAASLGRRLNDLEQMSNKILDTVGQQSASLLALQRLNASIENMQLETGLQLNEVQSTDVAETILKLRNDQMLLELTYAITAQVSSVRLIDFLR